jgi:hypothetical protein
MDVTTFLLKLLLVPLIVVGISIAMQHIGPLAAGLLLGLPTIGAPIYAFVVLEHGAEFGVEVAASTLLGMLPVLACNTMYSRICPYLPPVASMLAGWSAYFAVAFLMMSVTAPLWLACLIGLAVPFVSRLTIPKSGATLKSGRMPKVELLLRMVAAAALVFAATELARRAGPHLAGLFLPFPVAGTVVTVFTHRLYGAKVTQALIRGMMGGTAAYSIFFVVAAYALPWAGIGWSIFLGLVASAVVQGVSLWIVRSRRGRL